MTAARQVTLPPRSGGEGRDPGLEPGERGGGHLQRR
jgi:hypothetical protein